MSSPPTIAEGTGERVRVERWPTEEPLFVFVVLAALGLWLLLAVTIIGLAYVLLIGLFLFVSHVVFVAYVRGSAVRSLPTSSRSCTAGWSSSPGAPGSPALPRRS